MPCSGVHRHAKATKGAFSSALSLALDPHLRLGAIRHSLSPSQSGTLLQFSMDMPVQAPSPMLGCFHRLRPLWVSLLCHHHDAAHQSQRKRALINRQKTRCHLHSSSAVLGFCCSVECVPLQRKPLYLGHLYPLLYACLPWLGSAPGQSCQVCEYRAGCGNIPIF